MSHRFQSKTFTIAPGAVQAFHCLDFIWIADTTAVVGVSVNEHEFVNLSSRMGIRAKPDETLGIVYLQNSGGAPLTVTVHTGDGVPLDTRDSGANGGVVNVSVAGPNPLPCSVTGTVAVTDTAQLPVALGGAGGLKVEVVGAQVVPASMTQLPAALNADGSLNVHDVNPSLDPLVPLQGQAIGMADLVPHQVIAARAAGKKIAVRGLVITNESAVATRVTLLDGATEIMRVWMPANSNFSLGGLEDPLMGSAATALNAQNSVNASLVTVTAIGHEV